MKPPKFYRKFNYDKSLIPNKYLASMEQGISTIEEAKAKTGLSIGYPGWCLIYYALLSHLNPEGNNLIVETGTNQGWTTIMLAQALRDSNGRGTIYTVELDQENYKIALANFQQAGVADLIKAINGDSKIVLKEIVNKHDSIRVAFLDASHLFDDVIAEFEIILPALSHQSLVIFDNTYLIAEEHEDQRVNGALKEILKRHGGNLVNLEFVSWYTPGIAIWQKFPFDSLKTIEANNKSKHTSNVKASQSDSKKSQKDMMKRFQEELKLWEISQKLFSMVEYSDFKRALECIALIEERIIGRYCGDLGDKVAQYLSIIQFFRESGIKAADSIEIGTLFGGSCLIKLMAMRDLGVGGKVLCIDPMSGYYDQDVDPNTGLSVNVDNFFKNIELFGFSKDIIDLRKVISSDPRATENLKVESYATLMIDGDHSYKGVRYDWDNYSKFLDKGGIVLFDDYANSSWPDIAVFINELRCFLPHGWKEIGCLGTTLLLGRAIKKDEQDIEVIQVVKKQKSIRRSSPIPVSEDKYHAGGIVETPQCLDELQAVAKAMGRGRKANVMGNQSNKLAILKLLHTHAPAFQLKSGTKQLKSSEEFLATSAQKTNNMPRASHSCSFGLLEYFSEIVTKDSITIETGGGASTCILAASAKSHICINPDITANDLIKTFLQENNIDIEGLLFINKPSDKALPALDDALKVDVAFIDGNHSFPVPIIDWHYLDLHLKKGGILCVDDSQIKSVGILCDYLSVEKSYEQIAKIGSTVVFRKVENSRIWGWSDQAYNKKGIEKISNKIVPQKYSKKKEEVDKKAIYDGLNKCYFSEQCHEKEVLEHLPDFMNDVKIFVDIGASLGQYTLFANRQMQGGEIFAIEADPIRFEELERNCRKWELLSSNKLTALHLAISDRDARETFYITNSGRSGGLFKRNPSAEVIDWYETVVDSLRLDTFFVHSSPDFVKIDVEGSELRILKGATKLLKEGKAKFLIEVHSGVDPKGQKNPEDVFKFMESFGYVRIDFYGRNLFINEAATNSWTNKRRSKAVIGSNVMPGINSFRGNPNAPIGGTSNFRDKIELKSLDGLYKSNRAFIIGNGPSLRSMDLTKLKDEITFGVNCIFYFFDEMGFKPTFYVVEDKLVAEDRANEINALSGMTKIFGRELEYCLKNSDDVVWTNVIYDFSEYSDFPHFSKDASKCMWVGGTVSYLCMQLAYYMGFKEVYLVGFDHNYTIPDNAKVKGTVITSTSNDPNHFHPEYFGKGRRWHDPRLDRMEKAYIRAKQLFEEDGRKIYNATIEGKLEIFPRKDYESLFAGQKQNAHSVGDDSSSEVLSKYPSGSAGVFDSGNEVLHTQKKDVPAGKPVPLPTTPRFSHLVLDYTRLCNSRCTYCGIWKMKGGPELGLDAIERTFSSLRSFGLSTCYVTGGEPYISDKILDIARLLHQYLPNCCLSGATNGVHPKQILKRIQGILRIGIPLEVHVSINGSEPTHDATRGQTGFWRNAVYLLETLKSCGVQVVASMSLMPQTIVDLPYMQEFCAEKGVRLMFSWVRQSPRYGTVDEHYSAWSDAEKKVLRQLEFLPDSFECPGLSKRLVITPDGDVYPCEVYHPEILLGNVNKESLNSMLNSPRASSIAQMIVSGNCYWCQGAGEIDGSPKWMLMDCYRRHSQQYVCLSKSYPQAVNMPPQESRRIIESILSHKSFHQMPPVGEQKNYGMLEEDDSGSKVRISVVVCTYRNPDLLAKTLDSLSRQTLNEELFEVIVVDNNSQDNTKDVVGKYPEVRYVLETELGLSYARNTGISAARGDIIAFIDDDAEASPLWVEALLKVYDSIPEAWAVGGKVLPIWDAQKPEWLTEQYYRSLSLVEWGENSRSLHWPERIIGTNCSFRRQVFTDIGHFDTSLGRIGSAMLGNEDTEIQQRIHSSGHLVYYTPDAVTYHHVPAFRMTKEYFQRRSEGTRISEVILTLRSQGKNQEVEQLTTEIRQKIEMLHSVQRQQMEVLEASNQLLAQYKDKHRGQRCVIIGNGPSLNKMDLSFLKDEITFGMNRIYLMFDKYDFRPAYYVSVNPLVIEQSVEDILKIQAPKFLGLNGLPYIHDSSGIVFLKSLGGPSFTKDPCVRGGLFEGATVTYVAMQLAYFMGFSEVILIGVDHYFTTKGSPHTEVISDGDDPNHFHPGYFGKGVRWNLPDLKSSEIAYSLAKQAFEADGRRIIDVTFDGKLNIFPKENYKDLFEKYREIDQTKKGNLSETSFLNQQGEDLFSKGDLEEALNAFKKAIAIAPNFATVYNNLGVLYWQTGEVQKAVNHFAKALEIDPNDRDTILNCGDLFKSLEKFEDAENIYSSYLQKNPNDEEITRALADLQDRRVIEVSDEGYEYLVSAIVSTYNSEKFIRGCLEDLEAQTIADKLEIIVVNSGSEQNEEAIVKEFQKKYSNIKYIRTDQRETVYAAWNRGVKASSGKYITNANADDRRCADACERMVKTLESRPDIALVYANVIITEKENETFNKCTPAGNYRWLDWNRRHLLEKGCFMGPQPMWRRGLHDEYGYFDDTLVTSGDYEFWLRVSQTNSFLHIRDMLGLYLKSPDGIEHSNRKRQAIENERILSMYRKAAADGSIIRRFYSDNKIDLIRLHNQKGEELFQAGNIEGAKDIFQQILSRDPKLVEPLNNLGVIAFQQGGIDQAVSYFTSVLETDESYFEAIENLGKCGEAQKNYLKAAEWFERALKLKPDEIGLLNSLGNCLIQAEDLSKAREVYEKSLGLDGGQENIKVILRELGGLEEAKNKA